VPGLLGSGAEASFPRGSWCSGPSYDGHVIASSLVVALAHRAIAPMGRLASYG
jgi:hypothetical protein